MGLGGEDMSPEWKRVQVGKGPWRDGWGRYLGGEDPSGVVMDLGGSLGLCNGGGVGERGVSDVSLGSSEQPQSGKVTSCPQPC